MSEDYGLLISFKDQSDQFTHGFECGQIWEQLKMNKKFDKYLFHKKNEEQVKWMCRRFHYSFLVKTIDDTWCNLTAELNNALAN